MGLKVGPNFEDCNRIREWAAVGKNAQEISGLLQIEAKGVQIFLDSLVPKEPELTPGQKAAATRAANKAAAAEEESDGDQEG